MAKSKKNNKGSDFSFADFVKKLKGDKPTDVRAVETTKERKYFLIVCEGERTEPNYFKSYKKKLPKDMLDTIDISGEGDNTIGVVQKAIASRDNRAVSVTLPPYDEVWAVFDRDSFPAKRVNEAIQIAKANGIHDGFSNEAFELWYVLHFQYLDTGISRHQYIEVLNRIFQHNLGKKYTKNDPNIYNDLEEIGNKELAKKFAQKLRNLFTADLPADSKPLTNIDLLVSSLEEYINES